MQGWIRQSLVFIDFIRVWKYKQSATLKYDKCYSKFYGIYGNLLAQDSVFYGGLAIKIAPTLRPKKKLAKQGRCIKNGPGMGHY